MVDIFYIVPIALGGKRVARDIPSDLSNDVRVNYELGSWARNHGA